MNSRPIVTPPHWRSHWSHY